MSKPLPLTHEQQQEIANNIVGILDHSAVHQEVTPMFLRMVCDHYLRQLQNPTPNPRVPICFAEVVTECIVLQLRSRDITESHARTHHLSLLSTLARSMLRMDFKPRDISFDEAKAILQARANTDVNALLEVYQTSGVLKVIGTANPRLTFFHDTITEYLAAQYLVDECDRNPVGWSEVLGWLEKAAGGNWSTVRGIISALEDTVTGYLLRGQRGQVGPWLKAWLLRRLDALRVAAVRDKDAAVAPPVAHLAEVLTKLQEEGLISTVSHFTPAEYAALCPNERAGYWLVILTSPLPPSPVPATDLRDSPLQPQKVLWYETGPAPISSYSILPHGEALEAALRTHLETGPSPKRTHDSPTAHRQLLMAKKTFLEKERVLACDAETKFNLDHRIKEITEELSSE